MASRCSQHYTLSPAKWEVIWQRQDFAHGIGLRTDKAYLLTLTLLRFLRAPVLNQTYACMHQFTRIACETSLEAAKIAPHYL